MDLTSMTDEFLFALSRRVFVNAVGNGLGGYSVVSIRFVAKGLRQRVVTRVVQHRFGSVSIRFVAKGLRQPTARRPCRPTGFYSLCREGSSSTKRKRCPADGVVQEVSIRFVAKGLRQRARGLVVNSLFIVSIRFVAKGLRQPFFPGWAADQPCWCHYTHPTSRADLQVPGPCEIQASWLVCELHTRPRFAGFAHTPGRGHRFGRLRRQHHAAHCASTRTIPMPLPRKEPMPQ